MPFRWKVEPLKLLKEKGYTTYRLRKEKLFAESTVQKLRTGQIISIQELDTLCRLTGKPIGKLIEYFDEPKEKD